MDHRRTEWTRIGLTVIALFGWGCAGNPPPAVSDHPITDHPVTDHPVALSGQEMDALESAMTRLIMESRAELAPVRKRFEAGLRYGERLYLTVRLFKQDRSFEQAYIWIEDWPDDAIRGIVDSDLIAFKQPRRGDRMEFPESAVVDWTILGADGSEEGNRVGHYLESRGRP